MCPSTHRASLQCSSLDLPQTATGNIIVCFIQYFQIILFSLQESVLILSSSLVVFYTKSNTVAQQRIAFLALLKLVAVGLGLYSLVGSAVKDVAIVFGLSVYLSHLLLG